MIPFYLYELSQQQTCQSECQKLHEISFYNQSNLELASNNYNNQNIDMSRNFLQHQKPILFKNSIFAQALKEDLLNFQNIAKQNFYSVQQYIIILVGSFLVFEKPIIGDQKLIQSFKSIAQSFVKFLEKLNFKNYQYKNVQTNLNKNDENLELIKGIQARINQLLFQNPQIHLFNALQKLILLIIKGQICRNTKLPYKIIQLITDLENMFTLIIQASNFSQIKQIIVKSTQNRREMQEIQKQKLVNVFTKSINFFFAQDKLFEINSLKDLWKQVINFIDSSINNLEILFSLDFQQQIKNSNKLILDFMAIKIKTHKAGYNITKISDKMEDGVLLKKAIILICSKIQQMLVQNKISEQMLDNNKKEIMGVFVNFITLFKKNAFQIIEHQYQKGQSLKYYFLQFDELIRDFNQQKGNWGTASKYQIVQQIQQNLNQNQQISFQDSHFFSQTEKLKNQIQKLVQQIEISQNQQQKQSEQKQKSPLYYQESEVSSINIEDQNSSSSYQLSSQKKQDELSSQKQNQSSIRQSKCQNKRIQSQNNSNLSIIYQDTKKSNAQSATEKVRPQVKYEVEKDQKDQRNSIFSLDFNQLFNETEKKQQLHQEQQEIFQNEQIEEIEKQYQQFKNGENQKNFFSFFSKDQKIQFSSYHMEKDNRVQKGTQSHLLQKVKKSIQKVKSSSKKLQKKFQQKCILKPKLQIIKQKTNYQTILSNSQRKKSLIKSQEQLNKPGKNMQKCTQFSKKRFQKTKLFLDSHFLSKQYNLETQNLQMHQMYQMGQSKEQNKSMKFEDYQIDIIQEQMIKKLFTTNEFKKLLQSKKE